MLAGHKPTQICLSGDYRVLIIPYTLIYTLCILLGGETIKPVISVLTVLKMFALVCVLFAVSVVADLVKINPKNDFTALEPFLMGTLPWRCCKFDAM